jgi:ribosomal protein S18 acetylase RimI-like enzyme
VRRNIASVEPSGKHRAVEFGPGWRELACLAGDFSVIMMRFGRKAAARAAPWGGKKLGDLTESGRRQVEILCPVPATALGDSAVNYVSTGRGALRFFLGRPERRARLFAPSLNRDRAAIAVRGARVVGYATFKLAGRGPYAPSFADFRLEYGLARGLLGLVVFRLEELRNRSANLYLYGLNVVGDARRRGVGSALVDAIAAEAVRAGCRAVELEVASHNQRAIDLYARKGFVVTKTRRLGPLRHVFPFPAIIRMERNLAADIAVSPAASAAPAADLS